jgi:lysophospholipid acyltransferase (LPLAT)-like uncharacterized protein
VRSVKLRKLTSAPWVQKTIGFIASEYLRLTWKASRFVIDPPDVYERMEPELPIIIAMWHGQHFMMPFVKREKHRVKVLVSRHRDGAINAIVAERLGVGTIRGSGSHEAEHFRKGGVSAFMEMLQALKDGYNVALTADVPKVSRVAGIGIVKLASVSGRAILPVATATRNRIELKNWDRTAINLPFGRGAIVAGEAIRVAADADETELNAARQWVEAGLNEATRRAYALVDGPHVRRQS